MYSIGATRSMLESNTVIFVIIPAVTVLRRVLVAVIRIIIVCGLGIYFSSLGWPFCEVVRSAWRGGHRGGGGNLPKLG